MEAELTDPAETTPPPDAQVQGSAPEDQADPAPDAGDQADQAAQATARGDQADVADPAEQLAAYAAAQEANAAAIAEDAAQAEAARLAEEEAREAAAAAARKADKPAEDDLRARLAEIEAGNTDEGRPELLKRLRKRPKAKIEDANGTYRVRLHGVEVSATSGWPQALADWCRKARRTIMAGEAV